MNTKRIKPSIFRPFEHIIIRDRYKAGKLVEGFGIFVMTILAVFLLLSALILGVTAFVNSFFNWVRYLPSVATSDLDVTGIINIFESFIESVLVCISLILYGLIFFDFCAVWKVGRKKDSDVPDVDNEETKTQLIVRLVLQTALLQFIVVLPRLEKEIASNVNYSDELCKTVLLFMGTVLILVAIRYFAVPFLQKFSSSSSERIESKNKIGGRDGEK